MKNLFILLLILLCSTLSFSQGITISVGGVSTNSDSLGGFGPSYFVDTATTQNIIGLKTFDNLVADSINVDSINIASVLTLNGINADSIIGLDQATGNIGNSTAGLDTVFADKFSGTMIGTYGTQGFADSSLTIPMTQSIYTTITNPGDALYITGVTSGDLVFTGDSIQVVTAGDYMIIWDLSYSGANTDEYHISIWVNNVEQAGKGEGIRDMTGTQIGLSCGHTILTIPATHWVSLRIKNVNNNNDATVVASNFNISKR